MAKKLKKKTKKSVSSGEIKLIKRESKDKNEVEKIKKIKIRVVGIGGGGGNIVSEIASKVSKASFVAANTDIKSLKGYGRKVIKIQFGQQLTQGLGTGMNPELGRMAAQSEKEKIKKLLENQDLCILVVSLGGGTGSGAISTFAKVSKDLGNLTYGIFTLPFNFEGEKKMEIALNSLKEAKSHLNAVTIIPNERVFQIINKDTPLKEALSTINKFLAESLEGLIEIIYEPGLINIDFADFKTILEGRGRLAYLNMIESQRKEGDIKEITAKVFSSPLYPYTIRGAKSVLFNIAGEKNLSLSEVSQISKTISESVSSGAKIIFGISQRKKYSNVIKTILLAIGCGMKVSSPLAKVKKKKPEKRKSSASASLKSGAAIDKQSYEKQEKKPDNSLEKNQNKEKDQLEKPALKKVNLVRKGGALDPVTFSKKGGRSSSSPVQARLEAPSSKPVNNALSKNKVSKFLTGQGAGFSNGLKVERKKEPREKKVQELKPADNNEEKKTKESEPSSVAAAKIRKNGLQIKKEAEEFEKQMLEKEKIWEIPAFLRKKTN